MAAKELQNPEKSCFALRFVEPGPLDQNSFRSPLLAAVATASQLRIAHTRHREINFSRSHE
jgi:hypothetical protein